MSATRLDPFSARLHAIHLKGARAAPKPALQQESALEGAATTGMPVREEEARRLLRHLPGDDEDEALDDVRRAFGDDDGGDEPHAYRSDSLRAFVARDDDEPPRPGHFAPNIPRDYHEPESSRDAPRRRAAQDEDTQDQIRELQRRLSEVQDQLPQLLQPRLSAVENDLHAAESALKNRVLFLERKVETLWKLAKVDE